MACSWRTRAPLNSSQILSQTGAFDQILFTYLKRSGAPVPSLLGTAIPATSRPARSWLAWLRAHGSDRDLCETWAWMNRNRLLDGKSAGEAAWELWNRKSYRTAHTLWTNWLGTTQLLANTRFDTGPRETPFDWTLGSSPAVTVTRANGLDGRFSGTENVAFSGVGQFTVVPPGRYAFPLRSRPKTSPPTRGPSSASSTLPTQTDSMPRARRFWARRENIG